MDENKTILTAYPIELAQGDETCKYATFLISVLDEYDRMGRMIPKESGEMYHDTLRGFPIVAKLIKDRANRGIDFGAHEMRRWKRRNGQEEVTFDTYPIGSVVDTWIEKREVAGYDGEKDCIMARAKLWTCRSPEYFKVLDELWQEGRVSSSWELIVTDKEEASLGRKILRAFSFIGNAILGTTSVPAVRGAGMLEYAEAEEELCQTTEELNEALLKDLNEQEDNSLEDEIKEVTSVEETVVTEPKTATEEVNNTPTAEAADTPVQVDTQTADNIGVEAPGTESETQAAETETSKPETADDIQVTVEEPVVVPADDLVQRVTELSDALAASNEENLLLKDQIAALQAELDSLAPMREEFERMEQERAEAERLQQIASLRQLALDSGYITEAELAEQGGDETIRSLITNLDKAGLDRLIVERLVSARSATNVQTPIIKEFSTASAGTRTHKVRADITGSPKANADKDTDLAEKGWSFVQAVIHK